MQGLFQQFVERPLLFADADHAGLDPGQVQQVVDQPLQPIGLAVDDARELFAGRLVLGVAVGQQFHVGLDAGQGRLHLVADRGDELGVSLLQRLLVADVAEHGHGALGYAAVVLVRRRWRPA